MKEIKFKISAALMIIGILASVVVPFVVMLRNPHLTQGEIFTEIWWINLGGIALCFFAIWLSGDDEEEKGKVPKMRNPPPPPERKCEHIWVFSNLSALRVIKGAVPKYHCEKCGECLKT